MVSFEELGLNMSIVKAVKEIGMENTFPIQEHCIPLILKGKDVIGQAHTGTGKTAAFSLPLISSLKSRGPIQALVLVPTRELAMQVTTEIRKFSKYMGIRSLAVYGGQSIHIQKEQLRRGVQIIVATPGRLIDHLKQGTIQLEDVKFVVLDEADRMLDMGFVDDIKFILFYVNERRQTCLFSATMPIEILRLSREYMKEPEQIRLNEDEISLETIDQSYLIVEEREKFKHLCNFIRNREKGQQTIVFVATKQRTQRIADDLNKEGFKVITIHGDLSQRQRDYSMNRFKNGSEDILVATDIAARGIDVPTVGNIINYDIPEDPLIYFHRIGRTARAGASGKAISLVSSSRYEDFARILKRTELTVKRLNDEIGIEVPTLSVNRNRVNRQRSFNYNSQSRRRFGYSRGVSRGRYHHAHSQYKRG
ncbi:MAG: DEAD/DEAH box helicase [Nitrososphaeraceae archaeon]|jgi:ATP-dependent RNA helicase DeaD|nr:DEAD/DEAH box helicase [Nitrososphaeraceae archaeon]MDW0175194.1 DEAD/DEAH box helicase [Nitrososphaeraceae archaeon]MDW0177849.1 DEAD/DEAH box helicase [Nitrososphaeraceae archaeon]MDW0187460.1 DEAD/DEAH box helicase [Nitrososphaeraceae archaeon]MDW0188450.1 DEAD/DEAH box helicase [Nitrososphaeraceae archaeon]